MFKVGKVSYLNTLPLFFNWDELCVEFVEGTPAHLVRLLRKGDIQAGIISSVEYLMHQERYRIVPHISISSKERACSVMLFSQKPIERVESLYLTPASMTSKLLALYIIKEVYKNEPFITTNRQKAQAVLLIGDAALQEACTNRWSYVYDLGYEWYKLYRLPFVFALFTVRKEAPKELDHLIYSQVKRSVELFYTALQEGKVQVRGYGLDFLKAYFTECLEYNLDESKLTSLEIFKEILMKEVILSRMSNT
ncbi:MAG: hypothetical protein D6699_04545 [Aquificota bacterium]|nr:MAG: hypothetical protein D6699_04545 [Aquificota bacterium]